MKWMTYAAFLLALPAACTFAPQDNSVNPEFHPPFTYESWQVKHYVTSSGIKACALSSGYNGIIVTVGEMHNGTQDVVVASNRLMQPGATLTVTAGGKTFETYDTYFPPEMGRTLVQALAKSDKAYLEWSEFSGPSGRERVHVQNTIQLGDFSAKLKTCKNE